MNSKENKYLTEDNFRMIVRYHRNKCGLSYKELSNIVSIHYQSIFKFESGKAGISIMKLVKILEALGLNILIYDYEYGIVHNKYGYHIYQDFIDAIIFYRSERRYSRRQLGLISDISPATITKFESGTVISLGTLLKMLKGLNLKIILIDKTTMDI